MKTHAKRYLVLLALAIPVFALGLLLAANSAQASIPAALPNTGTGTGTGAAGPATMNPFGGCEPNYTIASTVGVTISNPGTTLVPGSQCDDCGITINLPFAYTLYGQSFTSLVATSNGQLDFGDVADRRYTNTCLPDPFTSYAIFPHWTDLTMDFQNLGCEFYPGYPQNCGIFTSVNGSAPNRVFNIEYRALSWDNSLPVHFEVRLFENSTHFDIIYAELDAPVSRLSTVGVERDNALLAQYQCPAQPNVISPGVRLAFTLTGDCGTPTAVATSTAAATGTPTSIRTNTRTATSTSTNTPTQTATNTPTNTSTVTPTETGTATNSPTVTNTAVPGSVVLRGHVLLQNRPAAPNARWIVPVVGTLRLVSGGPTYDFATSTDDSGYLTVNTNLPAGDYLWRVKNPQTIANGGIAALVAGLNTVEMGVLREGDADNNNCVSVSDFNITKNTYGRSPNDGGYDARADYNGDNVVTISDFNMLKATYGVCGEPPIPGTTPTVTPTPGVSLVGHITMQGRLSQPHPRQAVPVSVTLRISGGTPVAYNATTDQSGFFTITTGLTPGSYTWRVKHAQTLATSGGAMLVAGTNQVEMGLLLAGDANNDNCVSAVDFNTVKVNFGKAQGDPGYDPRADFNGDNQVTAVDFNLLKSNFGSCGPGPILLR